MSPHSTQVISAPKLRQSLCAFLIFCLSPLVAFSAEIAPKAMQAISDALQTQGRARIILLLEGPTPPTQGKLSEATKALYRARHNESRAQLAEGLLSEGAKFTVTLETKLFPYWGLVIEDELALDRLLSEPLVKRVYYDQIMRPSLNESRERIRVTTIGGVHAQGYTGAGQVVAVIDTGVDNDHPMLDNGKVVAEFCHSTTFAPFNATSVCPGGVGTLTGPDSADNPSNSIFNHDHGTHVAAIVAGDAFNDGGTELAGVA
ncbi:MAG: S8 family serine peptidase, partial [Myxococcota bacterium]|nr:S8 family serine peptidase [Myxococcota bacterium]